jgi:hypothetical protein
MRALAGASIRASLGTRTCTLYSKRAQKWGLPLFSHCHSMGLNATDLWDQGLFCSLIQIEISCSEQTMSSSDMKTVCRLAPILLDLLSMLTVYIRLGLDSDSGMHNLSLPTKMVFPHCLPLIEHWKSSSNDEKSFALNQNQFKLSPKLKLIALHSEWISRYRANY